MPVLLMLLLGISDTTSNIIIEQKESEDNVRKFNKNICRIWAPEKFAS
jgi:hypothetical protein